MTRIEFPCDRCGKTVSGLHTPSGTAGFYVVDDGKAWSKYRVDPHPTEASSKPPEHFVCDACIQAMPEYQADYGTTPEPAA